MTGKKGHGATKLAAQERARTDRKIIDAIAKGGAITRAEIARVTKMCDSTIWTAMRRLTDDFRIRTAEGKVRTGKRGQMCALYEVVPDDEGDLLREQRERLSMTTAKAAGAVDRLTLADLVIEGPFRVAALQQQWTVQERIVERERMRRMTEKGIAAAKAKFANRKAA